MNKSETITKLATALKDFQKKVEFITKDATNPFFKSKYASLEAIISGTRTELTECGLSFAQFPSHEGLTTVLMHESGEWIAVDAKMVIKEQTPQGQGSAITYMRRYALSAVLGIATEDDDDGNVASTPAKPVTRTKTPASAVRPKVVEDGLRAEIKGLCDEDAGVVLKSKEEYQTYVHEKTGLLLVPENYQEVITRLKALK